MKHLIIFLMLFLFQFNIKAQENIIYPKGSKVSISNNNNWGLIVSYGIVNFNGDIKQYDFGIASQKNVDFNELRYSYNIGLRKIFKNGIIEFSYSNGEMAGLRRYEGEIGDLVHSREEIYDPYNNFDGMGEMFLCNFSEFNTSFLYPLQKLENHLKDFKTYFKIGAGINVFTVQKKDLYNENHIYSYGYVDDANGVGKNSFFNAPRTALISIGLLSEYPLNDEINLTFESVYKSSSGDNWDASPVEKNNDSYYFFGVGLNFNPFN